MDGRTSSSWAAVFTPWFIFEALIVLEALKPMTKPLPPGADMAEDSDGDIEADLQKEAEREEGIRERAAARSSVQWSLFRVLQLALIVLQLDGTTNSSWWVVFWPIYIVIGFRLLLLSLACRAAKTLEKDAEGLLAREEAEQSSTSPEDSEAQLKAAQAAELRMRATQGLCTMGACVFMIIMAIALAAGANFPSYLVLLPVFLLSGCLLCCMACFICCARGDLGDLGDAEEELAPEANPAPVDPKAPAAAAAAAAQVVPPRSYGTYLPPPPPTAAEEATANADID